MRADLDTWWAEQASRRPRWQLWTRGRRRELLATGGSEAEARQAAEALLERYRVLELWAPGNYHRPELLRRQRVPDDVEDLLASARALAGAADGTPVRHGASVVESGADGWPVIVSIDVERRTARRLLVALAAGELVWRGRRFPLEPCPGLRLEMVQRGLRGGGLVLRRPSAGGR